MSTRRKETLKKTCIFLLGSLLALSLSQGTGASVRQFQEAPMLRELVEQGLLPPVEERLPLEPLVVVPVEEIGQFGGTWRRAHIGIPDFSGWLRLMYDPLLRWSRCYTHLIPGIARKWSVSPDGREFTFYLREGMRWSDGAPFTAADFLFWYEDVLLNAELTPVKPLWMMVGGEPGSLEKIDDYTIRFSFVKPHGLILQWLASWTALTVGPPPKHYLKQFHPNYVSPEALNEIVRKAGHDTWMSLFGAKDNFFMNPDRPVISAWKTKTGADAPMFISERNPFYWKVDPEGNQFPYIDRIETTLVGTMEAIGLKAVAGKIDMQKRRIPFDLFPLLMEHRERGNFRILKWETALTGLGTIFLNQNYRHQDPVLGKLLRDRRFRVALSLAINRPEIIDLVYMGLTEARQPVPFPGSAFYVEGAASRYTEFDLPTANRLLDEIGLTERDAAGYRLRPDGKRLEFTIAAFMGVGCDVAELLIKYWRALGIRAMAKAEDRVLWMTRAMAGEHHISVYLVGAGFKPLLDPVWNFPIASSTYWAPLYGLWYASGGEAGEEPTGDMKRLQEIYDEALITIDRQRQIELVKEAVEIQAQNLWRIGISGPFPVLAVVTNYMRNVPEFALADNPNLFPGNLDPFQFFLRQCH